MTRFELFGKPLHCVMNRFSADACAVVENCLLDCEVTWFGTGLLVEAISHIESAAFPEPLRSFKDAYEHCTDPVMFNTPYHPSHAILQASAFGLPHGQAVLFRDALVVPRDGSTYFQLQPSSAKTLTGILMHVIRGASWDVYQEKGSVCDACSEQHTQSWVLGCRGIASDFLPDQDRRSMCTCCFVQGRACTWPQVIQLAACKGY